MASTKPSPVSDLFSFISESPTPYHAARASARRLEASGITARETSERWDAGTARAGYARYGDGALLAWNAGGGDYRDGVVVLAAHTDSPALRVKERAASWRRGYLVLPTEIYGGPIQSTWADRELGVAGRLATADGSVHLFELADRGVVPNVAIHLNRTVNEGFAFNAQDHLAALVASDAGRSDGPATDWLFERCARAVTGLEIDPGSVVELEALLFDPGAGSFLGHDGSIYLSPRIDNLAGVFTNLEAFVEGGGGPRILALYNHEEVGSQTGEGAQSAMLEKLLARLVRASGGDDEDLAVALERSLVVSNDAAHALHPSYGEKYDPDYAPVLGGGPVLKVNGKYRYATTASTGARFARACSDAGVPMQRLANRSDIPSGSTVGPITWARTGIATVDVGIPILAMHSIREAGGTADLQSMISTLVAMLA